MSRLDEAGNDLEADDVFMTQEGILNAWVCAPKSMTMEQVQKIVSRKFLSGTTAGWQVQYTPEHEREDLLSPGRCSEDNTRQHWNCHC